MPIFNVFLYTTNLTGNDCVSNKPFLFTIRQGVSTIVLVMSLHILHYNKIYQRLSNFKKEVPCTVVHKIPGGILYNEYVKISHIEFYQISVTL